MFFFLCIGETVNDLIGFRVREKSKFSCEHINSKTTCWWRLGSRYSLI